MNENKDEKSKIVNIPSIKKRVLMTIIDWGILFLIFLVLEIIPMILLITYLQTIFNFNFDLAYIIKIISWVITPIFTLGVLFVIYYYIVIWPIKHGGQTLGMKYTGTKMVIITDDEHESIRPITNEDLKLGVKRFLWSVLDFTFWGLVGLIVIWKSKNNQSLSEKFTNTLVVLEKNK
ncbi:MAG: RDD family protein [Candidatus Heimdallarchaeota archaeon]|nr:RDD family protein [Candidatus Heimdallarchaeota archaeon]